MGEHAKYPPSSMKRLITCPASAVAMAEAGEQPQSEAAAHGTLLHEVAEEASINGRQEVESLLEDITDQNAVHEALDYVDMVFNSHKKQASISYEQAVKLASYGLPDVWGTADVIIDSPTIMDVIDYKFGKWPVYAEENAQMMCYGLGALAVNNSTAQLIRLHIVQPFIENYCTYEITREDLMKWMKNVLSPAIAAADSGVMVFNPTEDGCRFCPAGADCQGRQQMAVASAQSVFKAVAKLPRLTLEQLGEALEKADEYDAAIKALRTFVHAKVHEGVEIPGWKLVAGRGTRSFVDEEKAVKFLKEETTIKDDDLYKKKLISPAQAEGLARSLKKNTKFKELVVTKAGKPNVVRADDKRPAIKVKTAKQVFKEIA